MVKSMFASIAGLKTHQSRLDVISNNIANVNTWGYKTRSANFADAVYQNSIQGGRGDTNQGGSGGMNTSQLGFGVNMASISTDFTTGSWSPTGNGLHCMINGPSFFIVGSMKTAGVGTADFAGGDTGLNLTRVGIFSVDSHGYLVDDQGNYVYGYAYTGDKDNVAQFEPATLVPLRIPKGKANNQTDEAYSTDYHTNGNKFDPTDTTDRLTMQSYTIAKDGTIIGIDDNEIPYTIGKLAVATVENVNGLEQSEGYLYSPGENAGKVTATEAGNNAIGKILSGYLEMANVDLATEIANMITTQRGYQANSKIITVTDEMLEQLVNMKR